MAAKKISLETVGSAMQSRTAADFADETIGGVGVAKDAKEKKAKARVSPADLLPNDYNGFTVEMDDTFEELKDVINDDGMSNPIRAKKADEPGKYVILSGHRRWQAALANNLEKVEVVIVPDNFTPSTEIAYIYRENGGGRKDDPFGRAIMIQQYNAEQAKVPVGDRVPAKDALRINRGSYSDLETLSGLDMDILLAGRKRLLTKELGLALARTIKEHPTIGKRMVKEIKEILESAASEEEKAVEIKKIITAKEKKPAPADKPVNAFNTFTKAYKMMAEVNNPNFKLPSNKQKREDLKKLCQEMKEYADKCLEKLGE